MTHRDEIMARPARSWFQTSKERTALREESKLRNPTSAAATGDDDDGETQHGSKAKRKADRADIATPADKPKVKRDKFAGMTRKRRRAIQRDEILTAGNGADGEERKALPNQKAAAAGAKAATKQRSLGKQGGSFDTLDSDRSAGVKREHKSDGQPVKKKAKTDSSPQARSPISEQKPATKTAERPGWLKKKAAHSKPKFAKRTKRGRK